MAKRLDYDRWDKFDPDAEIERQEEEERQQRLREEAKRKQAPATPADLLDKFRPAEPPRGRRVAAAAAQAQAPGPLRSCSEATLRAVAEELGLDPELIKLVARSMTFTEAQIRDLSEDARFQTLRMRQAPEFEKVRFAIRRIAAAEQSAGPRVTGDVPPDDPEVLTAMAAALRMTDADLQALPAVERSAALALRSDPAFAAARQRVGQALGAPPPPPPAPQPSGVAASNAAAPRDPIWDPPPTMPSSAPAECATDAVHTAAAEAGLDPQLVRMCMQALRMTAEEVQALPYDAREKVKLVRDDADFAPLRKAASKAMEAEAQVEDRLRERARALDLDPEGIRSCAVALGMAEEEVAALQTEKERVAIRGIRTSEMFAPIRQICYDLGLATPPAVPPTPTPLATPAGAAAESSHPPAEVPAVHLETASEVEPTANGSDSTEVGPPPVEPQPAVVALCRRAMQLSEEALAVLPEETRANFRVLREDPAFEAVRAAASRGAPAAAAAPTPPPGDAGVRSDGPGQPPPVQRPKWRFCHTSPTEQEDSGAPAVAQQVTVRIELPLLGTLQGVDVNVTERELAVHAPGVYELRLPLPFAVDADAVQAKWLRKPRVLQVQLTKLNP